MNILQRMQKRASVAQSGISFKIGSADSELAMHFKSQIVNVRVDNTVATIEIKQVFVNDSKHQVEATYRFPTNPSTVVSGLLFQVGDRTVEGRVQKKQRAKERYDDAVAGGHIAMIVEESEKNQLEMKVGGIQPAQEVTVTLTLLKILEVEAGAYCLKVPAAYFLRGKDDSEVSGDQAAFDPEYSLRVEINT